MMACHGSLRLSVKVMCDRLGDSKTDPCSDLAGAGPIDMNVTFTFVLSKLQQPLTPIAVVWTTHCCCVLR